MASAQRSRSLMSGEQQQLPDPSLLDLAKIFVVAAFGWEERNSADAQSALEHLHFRPCQEPQPTLTLEL